MTLDAEKVAQHITRLTQLIAAAFPPDLPLNIVGIRTRRIALQSIDRGATVDGPPIFEADLGNEVDNMEGIDAHVTPEGDTVLTMISDDNFSMIQRTLLLQFMLME